MDNIPEEAVYVAPDPTEKYYPGFGDKNNSWICPMHPPESTPKKAARAWSIWLLLAIVCILFWVGLFAFAVRCANAEIGEDKYLHAAGSALISSTIEEKLVDWDPDISWVKKKTVAVCTTVLIGYTKELLSFAMDSNNPSDEGDMFANALGALMGFRIEWRW